MGPWAQIPPQPTRPPPPISPNLPEVLPWMQSQPQQPGILSQTLPSGYNHNHSLQKKWNNFTQDLTSEPAFWSSATKLPCAYMSRLSVDQVVPTQTQQVNWESHSKMQHHQTATHLQMSLGDISDIIYTATVGTNH